VDATALPARPKWKGTRKREERKLPERGEGTRRSIERGDNQEEVLIIRKSPSFLMITFKKREAHFYSKNQFTDRILQEVLLFSVAGSLVSRI
jgi:hypothetical protein